MYAPTNTPPTGELPKHMVTGITGPVRSMALDQEWCHERTGRYYDNPQRKATGTEYATNHGDAAISWCRWVKYDEVERKRGALLYEQVTCLVYTPEDIAAEHEKYGCTYQECTNAWVRYGK